MKCLTCCLKCSLWLLDLIESYKPASDHKCAALFDAWLCRSFHIPLICGCGNCYSSGMYLHQFFNKNQSSVTIAIVIKTPRHTISIWYVETSTLNWRFVWRSDYMRCEIWKISTRRFSWKCLLPKGEKYLIDFSLEGQPSQLGLSFHLPTFFSAW